MVSTKGSRVYLSGMLQQIGAGKVVTVRQKIGLVLSLLLVTFLVQSCASGGYAGAGIASVTATTITLDAGQSIAVGASVTGNAPLSWTLSGNCPSSGCGGLSSTTGTTITYTAPAPVNAPFQTQLAATIAGTLSGRTVTINVNPAPALSGMPPQGTVGVPYSFTFTASGGTAPLTLSVQSGSLPVGLSFNPSTATISGTPTAVGRSTFVLQGVDSSDVPYTITANEAITIAASGATTSLSVSGNPPSGTVGASYSTSLQASGGTAPYTWSVGSGNLPAGLNLNTATGVISGIPTSAGTAKSVIQARDAAGNTGSGSFTIVIGGGSSTTPITFTTGTLPSGTVGTPYTGTVGVSGGTAPYTCSLASGALPTGLTLGLNCTISGTPTIPGTTTVGVTVTDSGNPSQSTTGNQTITIQPGSGGTTTTVSVIGNPPSGTVGTPYSTTVQATGGTAPYTFTVAGGSLPAGLSLNAATGVISGTPTTSGTSTALVQARDAANNSGNASFAITVNGSSSTTPISLTTGTLPSGTVGTPYTGIIGITGGTAPYTCSLAGGSLPAGLTLAANCTISGTPTIAGTTTVDVTVTDSGNPAQSKTGSQTITINPASATLVISSPPAGTVNTPYTGTVPVSGGTAPYACSLTSGTLPAGLALGSNCVITGTPTASGSSTVTVKATDTGSPARTNTGAVTVLINSASTTPLIITTGTLPNGTVGTPYTNTIGVSGGMAPYTCTLAGGSLPVGLSLGTNCTVTGTPTTAGTTTANITVSDSSNPTQSKTGSQTITITPASTTPLNLTIGALPNGTVGTPYTNTIGVTGGMVPYTCTLAGGTLPAGLALGANCTVTGTPTTAGTTTANITVTDASNPVQTKTGPQTITINPASTPLSFTTGALPNGTVGTPYTNPVGVTGGTAPYNCSLASGALPAGLSLTTNCTVTGTPTTAGTTTANITVTDASNPAQTKTGPQAITINPASQSLSISSPPAGTVNVLYTGAIPVSGGTGPYTCVLSGGNLPAGLALGANCTITGTPTVAGSTAITVKATDGSSPARSNTGAVTVLINPTAATLVLGNPPLATVNTPYTGTVPVTGGSGSYTCSLASGALPAGLTLGSNCVITGTPTATGSATVQIAATDTKAPGTTTTGAVTITVQPIPSLTFAGTLPNGVVNQPYLQTLHATGGVGPYTYAVTAGALPAGLTLSSAGVVSGVPTTVGASGFTVTVTDSEALPQTVALPLTLLVTYASTPNDTLLQGPYAFLFQGYDDVVAGLFAYKTATAGSITADGSGAITTGEQDSNHQATNPSGNTIPTRSVLGTYTIGTDRRGLLTLTAFNADGTVATTTTYAIAVRAPVAPATNAASGSLIQFDSDQLVGTKGSGTLLAQNVTSITTGLAGSYAFGTDGDTPCLPTCTIGIAAGPVASVGQFTAAGGTVNGVADANIGSVNFASATLTGAYTAADSNGRVQLTLNNAKLAGVPYPTDYAAYVVDSNHIILLSTDKHSTFILQAGTAQAQQQATFSNASLGAAFVGYENSPVNPGLLGTTLQNVLNLSTATVFRGAGGGNGTCATTNVDSSGTTGVVNSLGGLVSAPLINALLGSYQSLGTSACTVAANGRAVFNYPAPNPTLQLTLSLLGLPALPAPRVVYLTGANSGYFLETGYAGLGMLEAQTGAPFSLASLNGTYVYGSVPASTVATINSAGQFTADGAGNSTSTVDRNVGVGTINILQLDVTASTTYTISDTTAGRFFLTSGEVVYEIVPGRFVLLEPELLNTSAYVALLF